MQLSCPEFPTQDNNREDRWVKCRITWRPPSRYSGSPSVGQSCTTQIFLGLIGWVGRHNIIQGLSVNDVEQNYTLGLDNSPCAQMRQFHCKEPNPVWICSWLLPCIYTEHQIDWVLFACTHLVHSSPEVFLQIPKEFCFYMCMVCASHMENKYQIKSLLLNPKNKFAHRCTSKGEEEDKEWKVNSIW